VIEKSMILDFVVDLIVRTALVFALFLLFTGHNAPGGGFVAGLVVGTALVLRFIARGEEGVTSFLPAAPHVLMGIGLSLAIVTGVAGWAWGGSFLESAKFEVKLPVLGTLKATSALPFDIGVFVVVVGLVATLVLSLGTGGEDT
jgi:multicomponent Na+:H+ antiporter subunit A